MKSLTMRISSSIFLICIFLISFSMILSEIPSTASKSDSNPFEYSYTSSSLTNFDIQGFGPTQQGESYVSFVDTNSIYYHNFSFFSIPQTHTFSINEFRILSYPSYINSSTQITACQYFSNSKINVFIVYYEFQSGNSSYIFLQNDLTGQLLNVQFLNNIIYSKSNKLFQFPNSNDIYIEIQTTDSFT